MTPDVIDKPVSKPRVVSDGSKLIDLVPFTVRNRLVVFTLPKIALDDAGQRIAESGVVSVYVVATLLAIVAINAPYEVPSPTLFLYIFLPITVESVLIGIPATFTVWLPAVVVTAIRLLALVSPTAL